MAMLVVHVLISAQGCSAEWHLRGKSNVSNMLDSKNMQNWCMHNLCRLNVASQTLGAGSAVFAGFIVIAITANSAKAKTPFNCCLG